MMAADAASAVALFGGAPLGVGLWLRGPPGPARDAVLRALRGGGDAGASGGVAGLRMVPLHTSLERLCGGTDFGASILAGREMRKEGLLEATGTILVLTMAERWDAGRAALVGAAMDAGRVGLVLLDEGISEEAPPASLRERCAYRILLEGLAEDFSPPPVRRARPAAADPAAEQALVEAALGLGVVAMRPSLMAAQAARLAAALAGRAQVSAEDAALAARLVLAPLATRMPEPPPEPPPEPEEPEEPEPPPEEEAKPPDEISSLTELVLEAVRVVLPGGMLAEAGAGKMAGKSGARIRARRLGRPGPSRAGTPRDGVRLDLMATLRAAAPWQTLRGRAGPGGRLLLRQADLRVRVCLPQSQTTIIFAVDASGSQAAGRLGEAKGAVERLLAESYVRRDMVSLLSFRGDSAELLLPPTRAPARARRCLATMPGGGASPLATGISEALALAVAVRRRGDAPSLVILTDGQANIAADGTPGRARATADALAAARQVREENIAALVIDTAPRRSEAAEALARAMGARFLALPRADAASLCRAARPGR